MSDNLNMNVWDRNKTIDQKYTKQANVKGQKITSFSLQSVVMMATKEFGMFGKGWGYEVETERFDEGAIIQDAVTHENGDITPEVKEITHTLIVRLWYMIGDEKITCPVQAGHTPYISRTKYGPSHDGEYFKKTLADSIKKSLSMLGFGADIFLGLMDSQEYQQILQSEKDMKAQSELPQKIEAFDKEVHEWATKYSKVTISHSLNAMHKADCQKIHTECRKLGISPEKYLTKAKAMFDYRFNELKKAYEAQNGTTK